jgi:serine O-acetyltransferase
VTEASGSAGAGSPHEDEPDAGSLQQLFRVLREDYAMNGPRAAISPGFHALAVYRFGRWQREAQLPVPGRMLLRPLYLVLAYLVQMMHGIELYPAARVGRRLRILHRGAVVNGAAEIGDDCVLRHYVTIGALYEGGECPRLGNRVELGPGAVIVGGVSVGDGARIGPNAVVTFDVPPGGRVVASPARITGLAGSTRPRGVAVAAPTHERVSEVVTSVLGLDEPPEMDEPLISSGLVDSLTVVGLVEALEEEFDQKIPVEEVGAETFDTIADMTAFLSGS